MPIPPPTSSSGSEFAAALVAGDWMKANPVPTPRIPAAISTGDAPAKVEMNRTESHDPEVRQDGEPYTDAVGEPS